MSTSATSHLTSTIESLSGGLTAAKPGASRSITSWIEELKGNPKLAGIAEELTRLKALLGGEHLDTAQLQKSLQALGQHTTKAAEAADGAAADKIKELGKLLTTAAGQLK